MLYKDKKWLEEQAKNKRTKRELAKELNVSVDTIRSWSKKLNVWFEEQNGGIRRNNFNVNFFEEINTEAKAYFLGFIAADGWVSKGKELSIKLHNQDEEILEKFCELIESQKEKIRVKDVKHRLLLLCSKKIVEDLSKYGIVQNKTKILCFPKQLKQELIIHYIRGLFDGDGHIGVNQCVFVTGSNRFAEELEEVLKVNFKVIPSIRKEENTHVFTFNRRDHTFIRSLYENSTIFLKRKKESFDKNWKNYIPKKKV